MINNLYIIRFLLKSWVEWYTFYFKIITRVIGEIILYLYYILFIKEGTINLGHTIVVFGYR